MARSDEVAGLLRRRIKAEEWGADEPLPRQEELARAYTTSKETVRAAIALLQAEGLLHTVPGLGTFVREPQERWTVADTDRVERDPAFGYQLPFGPRPGQRWARVGQPKASREAAGAEVAELLRISDGEPLSRVRSALTHGGIRVLKNIWLTDQVVLDAPDAAAAKADPGGYLDRIEEKGGHGPLTWTEYKIARLPTREEARLLKIPQAQPVLSVTVVASSARTGGPVAAEEWLVPGDQVQVATELRRAPSATWPVHPAAPPPS